MRKLLGVLLRRARRVQVGTTLVLMMFMVVMFWGGCALSWGLIICLCSPWRDIFLLHQFSSIFRDPGAHLLSWLRVEFDSLGLNQLLFLFHLRGIRLLLGGDNCLLLELRKIIRG